MWHRDVHDLMREGSEAPRMPREDERLAQAAVRDGRLDDDKEVDGGVQLVQPQLQHVELVREGHHIDDPSRRLAGRPRARALEARRRPGEVERLLGGRAEDQALEVLLHAAEQLRWQPFRVGTQGGLDGGPGDAAHVMCS